MYTGVVCLKKQSVFYMIPFYILAVVGIIFIGSYADKTVMTMAQNSEVPQYHTVIIDPGHGGVDGGATSYSGVLESKFNLDISLRLRDIMNLLGIRTVMIRTTDESVYTEGNTISAKKLSDLKERVRIVNQTSNGILISIHQNYFTDSRYSGAQVFYADTQGSKQLAETIQKSLTQTLNPDNQRACKKAEHIYLLQHITSPGILVECGFLSNYQEESLLRNETYQKALSSVIAATISLYLYDT